jgi:hypothetical protein
MFWFRDSTCIVSYSAHILLRWSHPTLPVLVFSVNPSILMGEIDVPIPFFVIFM